MKKVLTTIFVVLSSFVFGQGFTYSYVDPCSRQVKTLQVTNNQSITVNYLGNINSFSSTDFINGNFDNWVNQITAATANQPCDELLTNTQVSQNMFITQNLISTLTSVTAASTMTASNAVANSVSNSTSSPSSGSKRGGRNNNNNSNSTSDNQNNTSTDATGNNSQGNSSNSSTTQGGGTQQGGNTSNGSSTSGGNNSQGGTNNQSGGVSSGGSGQTQRGVGSQEQNSSNGQSQGQNVSLGNTKQTTSSAGGNGGTTNSVSNAAEATSSGSSGGGKGGRARVGSIVGTGDIVAIRVNEDKSNQLRGTMSVTKSNTNNTRAKGLLLNYTTTINNSNLTLYGAFNNKKRTNTFIVANSSMIDFERNFFNTTTALESKTFGKTSLMGGLNFTVGGLGGEVFTNISAVGGGFHPFKINKNLSGNLLILGVYSPFTKFYEGKWWDSGWLIVPFSSWDYAISKNFKYNVSLSGTYEVSGSVLQFQILTGGKILL